MSKSFPVQICSICLFVKACPLLHAQISWYETIGNSSIYSGNIKSLITSVLHSRILSVSKRAIIILVSYTLRC